MRADDQDVSLDQSRTPRLRLVFLGAEFLTWLYFHIDQIGGEVLVADLIPGWQSTIQKMQLHIGKQMTLKSLLVADMRVSISASTLEERGEVLQSIREGAYIDSLSLEITLGERVHNFVVQASDGAITQAKTTQLFKESGDLGFNPASFNSKDEEKNEEIDIETNLLLRMSNLDEIEDLLDGLFARFLKRRLAQAFIRQDIGAIRQKISEGLIAKLPKMNITNGSELSREEEVIA